MGVCLPNLITHTVVLAPLIFERLYNYSVLYIPATDSAMIILSTIPSLPANTRREDRRMHETVTPFILFVYQPDDLPIENQLTYVRNFVQ